jgi:hypothetical protein
MRILVTGVCGLVAILLLSAGDDSQAGEKKKDPKYTISDVMIQAHKGGLLKKVAAGEGDKGDAQKLLEMYTALAENKPPQGDAASWKRFTDGLVAAARAAVGGDAKAGKLLKKAANCMACHNVHK